MSDTPETDDEIRTPSFDFEYIGEHECVDASFAKRLERERDEARTLAEMYRNLSCETQCEAEKQILPWDNAESIHPDK